MSTLLPALIAGIVAGITLVALRTSRGLPFDRPNARSLHRHAVPRGGGLAVWVGWFAGIVWIPGARPWLLPLAAVVMVSFFDDRHGIPVGLRLFIQLAAAATWLWLAGPLPDVLMAAVLVVAIVWMANLYNFMDGSDGLSGTMAIVGFSAYALAASDAVFGRELAAGARFLRRRGCGAAGFPRRGIRHRRLASRVVASLVSAAGFPALYR
jgi:UDP-N-acetylmuramyl pentapeptide phosphotransferase/UDP-N-acetylglucosamine-1-phosphate transferase